MPDIVEDSAAGGSALRGFETHGATLNVPDDRRRSVLQHRGDVDQSPRRDGLGDDCDYVWGDHPIDRGRDQDSEQQILMLSLHP